MAPFDKKRGREREEEDLPWNVTWERESGGKKKHQNTKICLAHKAFSAYSKNMALYPLSMLRVFLVALFKQHFFVV